MRMRLWLPLLWFGLLTADLDAASIKYQVTNLGIADVAGPEFLYSYSLSGLSLGPNQELAFLFDPALYGSLSDAHVGNNFSVIVFQPNDPPGTPGVFSAFTSTGSLTPSGPFNVTFVYKGVGMPGAQRFSINQYDHDLNFISTIDSGSTLPFGPVGIPEPGSLALVAAALLTGALWTVRRRLGVTAQR